MGISPTVVATTLELWRATQVSKLCTMCKILRHGDDATDGNLLAVNETKKAQEFGVFKPIFDHLKTTFLS